MRVATRLVGAVVGLALAALGIFAVAEGVVRLLDMDPLVGLSAATEQLRDLRFDSSPVVVVLVIIAALGLWLVQVGLSSGQPRSYPVMSPDDSRKAQFDRHGLERRLAHRVRTQTEAADCRVRIRRQEIAVDVQVRRVDDDEAVKRAAYTVIDAEQEALGMKQAMTARVVANKPQPAAAASSGRVQ